MELTARGHQLLRKHYVCGLLDRDETSMPQSAGRGKYSPVIGRAIHFINFAVRVAMAKRSVLQPELTLRLRLRLRPSRPD